MTDQQRRPPIVDAFITLEMPTYDEAPEYMRVVAGEYFRNPDMFGDKDPELVLQQMDDAGVAAAVLSCDVDAPGPMLEAASRHPDRFVLSVTVDPRLGMRTIRTVERMVREHDVRLIRVLPFTIDLPPNDRAYYGLYAKCIELGVPISVNCGIPGPPLPAAVQQPIHFDDVCRFFPELTLIMAHGADPWWGEAIRLLQKYPNLYMMASAWAPKYLPQELIHFMNTRGRQKVMFASDYPALSFERCAREALELPLDAEVMSDFLFGIARRLFWPR